MPFLYLILLVASLFFYILYVPAFSFYLFAFLLAVPVVLFILTLITAKKLKISFVGTGNTAGRSAQVPMMIRVENRSVLPVADLTMYIEYRYELEDKVNKIKISTPVFPRDSQLLTLNVSASHYGTVHFKLRKALVRDMLRLFRFKVKSSDESALSFNFTVFPDRVMLENKISNYASMGLETDEYSKTEKGDDPSEVFDVRDYVEGDKISRIHWKLTAKQDKPIVKEYSMPLANSIVLLVDLYMDKGAADKMERYDCVIEAAAAISQHLMLSETAHRLVWFDNDKQLMMNMPVTDEDSCRMAVDMLLHAPLYDRQDAALKHYLNDADGRRCGHLIYMGTAYSPSVGELMSDNELALRYTCIASGNAGSFSGTLMDGVTETVILKSGKVGQCLEELVL